MLFGIIFGAVLTQGPLYIGHVSFDIASLVYAGGAVVMGMQAVLFALLAKYYGYRAGFLPVDEMVKKFFRVFTMERIISAGFLIFMVSFIGGLYSVGVWMSAHFGDLIPREIITLATPSVVGAICGSELMMSGIFLGVLDLPHKEDI